MELIEKNNLLNDIADFPYGYRGMVEAVIAKQPTIDAVPVVRCKDCKMWKSIPASILSLGNCKLEFHERISSWSNFCCWGERKNDAVDR